MKQNCSTCQFREWAPGIGFYCNAPKECSQWLYAANAQRELELNRLAIGGDDPVSLQIVLSEDTPMNTIEIIGQDERRIKVVNVGK